MPTPNPIFETTNCNAPRRLRVLISAYACEPGKGSEPGVGWNFSREMAKYHDVWVLTRSNNRKVIEEELAKHPVEGFHFFYHDLPKWAAWWKKGGRGVLFYYYLWQLTAISKVRGKHQDIQFDLSHHVTFVKYWAPSCLAWLNIPFIWGPVGGAEVTPRPLMKTLDYKGKFFEYAKLILSRISEIDPCVRKTAGHSVMAYASTPATATRLIKIGVSEVKVMTQIGMGIREIYKGIDNPVGCRFISIGRMIYWKGFVLGLKAFSELGDGESEYWFVGDGSCRSELERFAETHGLNDRVKFFGSLSRSETLQVLEKADVLVHPSYHDSAGLVCLEAMAMGRPVICLNTGGPAELVDNQCGFLVSVDSEQVAIEGVSSAMECLISNKPLRMKMGENAQQRVQNFFLWEKMVRYYSNEYFNRLDSDQR